MLYRRCMLGNVRSIRSRDIALTCCVECRRGACILVWWRYSSTRRRTDKALGDGETGRAVVVEIFAVEFIQNRVKQNCLFVDSHH